MRASLARRGLRRIQSRSVRLVLSLGVLVSLSAPGTLAYFIDTVPVSSSITAARVDLQVQGANSVPTYTAMNDLAMTPGGSTAGVLLVTNNGTVPLDYYVTSTATNTDGKGLAAALSVKVTGSSSVTGSAPNETCGGTALTGAATSFTTAFVGSVGSPRTLAAGASETLCIQASLSSTAPTTMQTATTNVGFSFTAATNPATAWSDSVAVSGTTLGTATILTPFLNCGATNQNQVSVNWAALAGATGYRIFYGTGGSTVEDLPATPTGYPFKNPASGTAWIRAIYGNTTWMSGDSNTRTYFGDGVAANSTCS